MIIIIVLITIVLKHQLSLPIGLLASKLVNVYPEDSMGGGIIELLSNPHKPEECPPPMLR